jgi:hypothetical protein
MDWEKIKIKAVVCLKFLKDRKLPIQQGYLGCPSRIDSFPSESMWDVRFRVSQDHVSKNEIVETQITFLSPDVAEKYLRKGSKITLWELGDFAEGEITELLY